MEKKSLLLLVLFGITLVASSILLSNIGGDAFPLIKQLLIAIFSLFSFISLFFLFRYYGIRAEEGKVWFLLSAGFFLFFLGEAVNLFLLGAGGAIPSLSYGDCIKLLAYPFIFSSMFLESKWIGMGIKEGILPHLPILLLLLFVLAYFTFIPAMASNADPLEKMFGITFPILSLGLFIFSIMITKAYRGGLLSSSWKMLSAAFGARAVADWVFLYSTLGGANPQPGIFGFLFILSYSLVVLAVIFRSASWNVEFEGL